MTIVANKHVARVGHEFAAAMTADTPIIEIAKMVSRLASALDKQSELTAQLAMENTILLSPENWLKHSEEGAAASAIAKGNGASEDEALLAGMKSIIACMQSPATDAAIASLRAEAKAEAIPDGYVLVPQEMHLTAEAMEGICFHCGDGGHQFGEFTDGTLFVGEVDYGDGKKVYGLHIATAEYPEEGCSTICEFARQLRESKGEVQS